MATREELGAALQAAHAAGDDESAAKLAEAYSAAAPVAPEGKSLSAPNPKTDLMPVDSSPMYRDAKELVTNIGGGLATGAGKLMAKYGMALPNAVRDIANRQMPGTTSNELEAAANETGPAMGANPESIVYKGAKAAPKLVAETAALSPGVTAVAKALPRALGATRNLVADVGVNAAYEGAKAGSEGQGITDVMKAAGMGAGGAGLGHFAGGLAQRGISPGISQSAQRLIENDITPTYGMAAGRTGSKAEDLAGYIPIVGPAIDRARGVALKQYSRAEVNRATEGIGFKTTKIGEDAVHDANKAIDRVYETHVDRTHMPAIDAQNAIVKTNKELEQIPLLTEPQIAQVNKYIETKIQPELSFSQQTGNKMPGRTARNIDAELGAYARKYEESTNPADHELGAAFRQLQANLRDALQSTTPGAKEGIEAANAAFRNMLPVQKAMSKGAKDIGEFTPMHMYGAMEQTKQLSAPIKEADPLNRAARELLPTGHNPFRTAMQAVGAGSAVYGDPLIAGGAMLGIHSLYSEPVRKAIMTGVLPKGKNLPFTAAQLAARIAADNQAKE